MIHYPDRKRHDFSYYTSIDVTEGNAMKLAEIYRERWDIKSGYLEKKEAKEKTHSPEWVSGISSSFLLLNNIWILLNLLRRIAGNKWITFMDFIIAMSKGSWHTIMKDNG